MNNAFDLGIIDPQQLEQQIQDQNDNDELSNLPSGWEGMALPDESRNSSVTTDTPIDPEDDQPGPSTRPPVKSRAVRVKESKSSQTSLFQSPLPRPPASTLLTIETGKSWSR